MRVITLTTVLVYLLSILARAAVIRYLVPFFSFKNIIWYEIQMVDELVVGSFGPPDARAACDGIRRHFANGGYLLKVR